MAVKIKTTKEIEDNVYSVTIECTEFSGTDLEKAEKFGEPSIQIGGSFTAGSDTVVFDSEFRDLPSNFPIVKQFHGDDYTSATAIATEYATTILESITTAVTALRAKTDTFSGEELDTI